MPPLYENPDLSQFDTGKDDADKRSDSTSQDECDEPGIMGCY
jgi:hypothetical protein